ncbi:MAG TPA: tryptophan 7-halogenase, partial [Tepidisphaeraceae bacterium]|nr:tryptophan 7-halogenase [Tepidisphaeraceae bacterium]
MINKVIVLGAGTAGLMAALALKRKIPQLQIQVIRSPEISVIGVGESTTPQFPQFLFEYLGIKRKLFYEMARPTWKVGIHFLWGPRESFEFTFD